MQHIQPLPFPLSKPPLLCKHHQQSFKHYNSRKLLTLKTKGIISIDIASSTLGWFLTGKRMNLRTSSQKLSCTSRVMVAFSMMTAHRYRKHCPAQALHCGGLPASGEIKHYYSAETVSSGSYM